MGAACGSELSQGTTFLREDPGNPGTYVQIAKVIEWPNLDFSAETKECQDPEAEAAANGFISHFKTGRKDAGEFTATLAWKSGDATQATLYADYLDDNEHNYRIQWSDENSTKADLTCLVIGWGKSTPYNDRVTIPVKFRINGEPDFAP